MESTWQSVKSFAVAYLCIAFVVFSPASHATALSEYAYLNNDGDDTVKASTFRSALSKLKRCMASSVDELLIGAAEYMITQNAGVDTVTDMLESVAAECVNAEEAVNFLKRSKFTKASQIKRSRFLERGMENYGRKGSLSRVARDLRVKRGYSTNRNVAVVEYTLNGKKMKPLHAVSSGTGNLAGHAEKEIISKLNKKKGDIKVLRIYSERSPCTGSSRSCFDVLRRDKRFEHATYEYTFAHNSAEGLQEFNALKDRGYPIPEKMANPFIDLSRGLGRLFGQ